MVDLHRHNADGVVVIDLRSTTEYARAHIKDSVNIPFTTVLLGDVRLDALQPVGLEKMLANRIVIIVSCLHENAVLVCLLFVRHGIILIQMILFSFRNF